MTLLFLMIQLSSFVFFSAPAAALELRDYDRIIALVRAVSSAGTTTDLDRVLREASTGATAYDTEPADQAYGVIWFDNWNPRARIWIRGVEAEYLFRDVLMDQYLIEGVEISGKVDLELEIRSGRPATFRGRLKLRNAVMKWRKGDFAMVGMNGTIPFNRTIGEVSPPPASPETKHNIDIKTLLWADRPLATNLRAVASYRDRVLRYDQIELHAMGGSGVGSVVIDHRVAQWRMAAMIRLKDIHVNRLSEVLPGLPILARVTMAHVNGDLGLIFSSPAGIDLHGKLQSTGPGVIEISPKLFEKLRESLDDPVIPFQKLSMDIGRYDSGVIEAQINLYRQSAQSLRELVKGSPFSPYMMTIRFPILPFVAELRKD